MGKVYVAKHLQKKSQSIDANGNIVDRDGNVLEKRSEEQVKPVIKKTSVRLGADGGITPQ